MTRLFLSKMSEALNAGANAWLFHVCRKDGFCINTGDNSKCCFSDGAKVAVTSGRPALSLFTAVCMAIVWSLCNFFRARWYF